MPVFASDTASQTQAIEGFLTRSEDTQSAGTMGVVMENLAAARR